MTRKRRRGRRWGRRWWSRLHKQTWSRATRPLVSSPMYTLHRRFCAMPGRHRKQCHHRKKQIQCPARRIPVVISASHGPAHIGPESKGKGQDARSTATHLPPAPAQPFDLALDETKQPPVGVVEPRDRAVHGSTAAAAGKGDRAVGSVDGTTSTLLLLLLLSEVGWISEKRRLFVYINR